MRDALDGFIDRTKHRQVRSASANQGSHAASVIVVMVGEYNSAQGQVESTKRSLNRGGVTRRR